MRWDKIEGSGVANSVLDGAPTAPIAKQLLMQIALSRRAGAEPRQLLAGALDGHPGARPDAGHAVGPHRARPSPLAAGQRAPHHGRWRAAHRRRRTCRRRRSIPSMHDLTRTQAATRRQIKQFYDTGAIVNECAGACTCQTGALATEADFATSGGRDPTRSPGTGIALARTVCAPCLGCACWLSPAAGCGTDADTDAAAARYRGARDLVPGRRADRVEALHVVPSGRRHRAVLADRRTTTRRTNAKTMLDQIDQGAMPPFDAREEADCTPRFGWKDDPRLSIAEKPTLHWWVEDGTRRGHGRRRAGAREHRSHRRDARRSRRRTAFVAAGDRDQFICTVLDPQLGAGAWMTGLQVRPGNPIVVHHVVITEVFATGANADADRGAPGRRAVRLQPEHAARAISSSASGRRATSRCRRRPSSRCRCSRARSS